MKSDLDEDEELRRRIAAKSRPVLDLELVLRIAAGLLDLPTELSGETVGIAHYRIHAKMGAGACAVLERRLSERLPADVIVDVAQAS